MILVLIYQFYLCKCVPRVGGGDPLYPLVILGALGVPRVGGGDPIAVDNGQDKDGCSPRRRG